MFDHIICPSCGHIQEDVSDVASVDELIDCEVEYDCEKCGKPLIISAEIEYTVDVNVEEETRRQQAIAEQQRLEREAEKDPNQVELL